MSKKIFINNLNTFVSKQLLAEFRNDQPAADGEDGGNDDANLIYGTYIDKDSSDKPLGIKKMLKRSKPRLAMKYLSECDLIIYDLHAGNPTDVRRALEALKKYKSEDEKVLILISSLMAWQGTPKNLEEIKTQEQLQAEEAAAKKQQEGANEEGEEENQEEKAEPEPSEKEEEEEGAEQEESQPPEEEEVIEPPKKERKRYKHLPYTELDYQKRSPISEYQIIKDIEDEVLNFKSETGNVKTYVISAGILYGKGEAIFNQHIKKAWLQDPVRLPYVGDGDNLLPTIHVTDLARMVKAVFEKKPNRKYIFAIDNNKKPTQKKLIAAISNGIGTGLIESIDVPETFKKAHPQQTPIQLDLDWKKSLLLDLKVTPSSLFIKPEDPQPAAGGEDDGEGGEEAEIIEMDWLCKPGLPDKIDLVKAEFAKERNLRPVKILIMGPPCAGKSFYAEQVAQHYNIPHIHMQKLLQELLEWDQEKDDRYKKRVAECEVKIEELKKQRALQEMENSTKKASSVISKEAKEDGEGEGEDGEAKPAEEEGGGEGEGDGEAATKQAPKAPEDEVPLELDSDDDFKPIDIKEKVIDYIKKEGKESRIPEDIINEAVRWRLNRNDCQNRGYVLDGYPKNYRQAYKVFVHTPPAPVKKAPTGDDEDEAPAEEEEEAAAALKPVLQTNIYPESVVSLRSSDIMLKRRSRALLKANAKGAAKWDREKLVQKLAVYNEENDLSLFKNDQLDADALFPTQKFFQDNKTELFELDAFDDSYEGFESMRIYAERFSRPYNYLKSNNELNAERETYLLAEEAKTKESEAQKKKDEDEKLKAYKASLEKLADERMKDVMAHMLELESSDGLTMRQFLMKYIIPVLAEGMIEVWKVQPLDPVDYLAEYIFKKSNNC